MTTTKLSNPKDALSTGRVPLNLWPPVASAHGAMAMAVGARKYGAWNWREIGVRASVYIAAALRHLTLYAEGEDIDESGCRHLAHVLANIAILLDAEAAGKLTDDRNGKGGYPRALAALAQPSPQSPAPVPRFRKVGERWYRAVTASKEDCTGCTAVNDTRLCAALAPCIHEYHEHVIWEAIPPDSEDFCEVEGVLYSAHKDIDANDSCQGCAASGDRLGKLCKALAACAAEIREDERSIIWRKV